MVAIGGLVVVLFFVELSICYALLSERLSVILRISSISGFINGVTTCSEIDLSSATFALVVG